VDELWEKAPNPSQLYGHLELCPHKIFEIGHSYLYAGMLKSRDRSRSRDVSRPLFDGLGLGLGLGLEGSGLGLEVSGLGLENH